MSVESYRERREFYKAKHMCVICGQEEAFRNYTECVYCRMKKRDKNKSAWDKVKNDKAFTEKENERYRTLYQKRKEQGLCPKCGIEITDKNYVYCEKCRAKHRESKRKISRENGAIPLYLRTSGLYCYQCLKPLENPDTTKGTQFCEECKKIAAANIQKNRKNIKPENDKFRQLNDAHFRSRKKFQEDGND